MEEDKLGTLGSGEPLGLPKDFGVRLAKSNNAGPITIAFMGILDAQRNLNNIELERISKLRKQYEERLKNG